MARRLLELEIKHCLVILLILCDGVETSVEKGSFNFLVSIPINHHI